MKGILGRKIGMTQVFSDKGQAIPVTLIEIKENVVTSVFTKAKDGYDALQLASHDKKISRVNKPLQGHFKKAKTQPKYFVKEIRNMTGLSMGDKIDSGVFQPGQLVDVTGISKGKGFAGAIKRHNQSIGPKSHGGGGGSKPVRQTGSLGNITGNRVFKGMTMPGHMGAVQRTVQNLEVVLVDPQNELLLVKGAIPGPRKSFVIVKEAIKTSGIREKIQLVNTREVKLKNELLEEAKHVNAQVNTEMSIKQMEEAINAAKEARLAQEKLEKEQEELSKVKAEAAKIAKEIASTDESDVQKLEELQKTAAKVEAKIDKEQKEVQSALEAAKASESKSEKLQVKSEEVEEDLVKKSDKE